MFDDFDLFYFYRWLLVVFVTTYGVVRAVFQGRRAYRYLRTNHPTAALARDYMLAGLASLHLRRFAGELVRIALLLIALLAVLYVHRRFGFTA
jgi:hypothetical protein